MPNFFTENTDMLFQFENLNIQDIVQMKEKDYTEAKSCDYAPDNYEDAMDGYRRVLTAVGELSGTLLNNNAAAVDEEGSKLHADGTVHYAKGIQEALDAFAQADLMGFCLPRKYGGMNFPVTLYTLAIEMVARADASFMNIFGLQDIADTVNRFGTEDQRQRYLPRFCTGEVTGAMVLTEPDAGSDLQDVQLRATQDETGQWYLNGVKRFITNGCGKILLVLARSEEGDTGGRGLSLYVCENDHTVWIRRTENKMGIHGSPTCEMQFNNTKAELVGLRKRGLIRYVMALMNAARLGISAQGLGIAQAAYTGALSYARDRVQFGKAIADMPPVYAYLTGMKLKVVAARELLYETAKAVDMEHLYEKMTEEDDGKDKAKSAAIKTDYKKWRSLADALTPMSKYYSCEIANQNAFHAISVLGGSGYMKDYPFERYYRDARITNIYEGTTELQVVASIGPTLTGDLTAHIDTLLAQAPKSDDTKDLLAIVAEGRKKLTDAVALIKGKGDENFRHYFARACVDIQVDLLIAALLLRSAARKADRGLFARKWIVEAEQRMANNFAIISKGDLHTVTHYREMLQQD